MKGNLAVIRSTEEEPDNILKDGDGDEGGDRETFQVTIDVVQNGYVLTKNDSEGTAHQEVYLFEGTPGPKELIQAIIEDLGLIGKVRIQK